VLREPGAADAAFPEGGCLDSRNGIKLEFLRFKPFAARQSTAGSPLHQNDKDKAAVPLQLLSPQFLYPLYPPGFQATSDDVTLIIPTGR
jgi:hypothetical protein